MKNEWDYTFKMWFAAEWRRITERLKETGYDLNKIEIVPTLKGGK